jgi:DNA repair photolyase
MVNLSWAERKSTVLGSSSLACLSSIPSINLTSGCAHDCIYCYARGYSGFPGENNVVIYQDTLEKLKKELLHKRSKPQAVYFSPSSDVFQPIPEVLELTHSIFELLLSKDIGLAFLTKGRIPDKTMSLLLSHSDKVRAQIGINTHDDNIRCLFEPNAAGVDIRINQMTKMAHGGIKVEARVIPVLPGVTDNPDSISSLLHAIVDSGVKKIAISTLFLRPAIAASLSCRIPDKAMLSNILSFYREEKRVSVRAYHSSIIPLSQQKREMIYAHFIQVANEYNLNISICGCMNPDIGGVCNIAGKWPINEIKQSLFVIKE